MSIFCFSDRLNGKATLGRIVVHDRITVESEVLPKYFNHSSFASLRRQLNYFSFVRLGKGRQRESTYINENVVELDDILHLKRRSSGRAAPKESAPCNRHVASSTMEESGDDSIPSVVVPVIRLPKVRKGGPSRQQQQRQKRRRLIHQATPKKRRIRTLSPVNHFVSEDENSLGKQYIALDLTKPAHYADNEILAGCTALLELATRRWD